MGVRTDVLDILMELLQNDPITEVRKAVLLQIDINDRSLPVILSRARDRESSIRKLLFASKMPQIDPLVLSIDARDTLLKAGLSDRDPAVHAACLDMIFTHWLPRTHSNLVTFLTGLDVIENEAVAEKALLAFYEAVPNLFSAFPPSFFDHLTVETIFVLRTYLAFVGGSTGKEGALLAVEDLVPELSVLAACITRFYQFLVAVGDDPVGRCECEFILKELMAVCVMVPGDEMGRRALLSALEDVLVNMTVSDGLFSAAIAVYRVHCFLDFIRYMTQLAYDFASVQTDDADQQVLAEMRAVQTVSATLRNTADRPGPVLLAVLNDLIIPAINSRYATVQSIGLECLGLYCELAMEYKDLFIEFLKVESTKADVLRVLLDLVLLKHIDDAKELASCLYDTDPKVLALAVEGFCKLLFHDRIVDVSDILHGLLVIHFLHHDNHGAEERRGPAEREGEDSDNRMKQCLSFFLQTWSFSSKERQGWMRTVLVRTLVSCLVIGEDRGPMILRQLLYLADPINLGADHDAEWMIDIVLEMTWTALEHLRSNPTLSNQLASLSTQVIPSSTASTIALPSNDRCRELAWLLPAAAPHLPKTAAMKRLLAMVATAVGGSDGPDPQAVRSWRERLDQLTGGSSLDRPVAVNKAPAVGKVVRKRREINTENLIDNIQDILD